MAGVEARTGVPVRWRPFLLGAVFKASGNEMPARIPAKARWMMGDEVTRVYTSHAPYSADRPDTARLVLIQLHFRNGAVGHIECNMEAGYGYEVDVKMTGGRQDAYRERFDLVTARAVAPLNTLVEYLLPLVAVNGLAVVYKGPGAPEEFAAARQAIRLLGGETVRFAPATVPFLNEGRFVLLVKKVRPMPGCWAGWGSTYSAPNSTTGISAVRRRSRLNFPPAWTNSPWRTPTGATCLTS